MAIDTADTHGEPPYGCWRLAGWCADRVRRHPAAPHAGPPESWRRDYPTRCDGAEFHGPGWSRCGGSLRTDSRIANRGRPKDGILEGRRTVWNSHAQSVTASLVAGHVRNRAGPSFVG